MQVKDIMTKNVITIEPDETVSQALAKMKARKIHQLPVVKNGNLYGIIGLKNIVTKNIDTASAKVSSIASNVTTIDAGSNAESAAELLLKSGLRSLPVTDGGKLVGIISETDFMKVANQFLRNQNIYVSEIMTDANYLAKDSTIGAVKMLMLNKNISRVPIIDKNNVVGIIGTFDLIHIIEGKQTMEARGGRLKEPGTKEKLNIEKTPVGTAMRSPTIIGGDKTIRDVIGLLKEHEEVVVQHEGKIGVVTHRDILELFAQAPKKQVYVQITGMHDEGIEFKVMMDKAVDEFVQKMGKVIANIELLAVHVEKMHKQGARFKYSIRTRFRTPIGFFVAHAWGWKPLDVIQDVFKNLEREVMHKYGKMEDVRRHKRHKDRYV